MGTLAAEFTVPLAQWLMLRGELPYGRYLGMGTAYSALGMLMLLAVRLVRALLPFAGWWALGLQVVCGAAVYGLGCLLWWKLGKRQEMLRLLRLKRR